MVQGGPILASLTGPAGRIRDYWGFLDCLSPCRIPTQQRGLAKGPPKCGRLHSYVEPCAHNMALLGLTWMVARMSLKPKRKTCLTYTNQETCFLFRCWGVKMQNEAAPKASHIISCADSAESAPQNRGACNRTRIHIYIHMQIHRHIIIARIHIRIHIHMHTHSHTHTHTYIYIYIYIYIDMYIYIYIY